MRNWKLGLISVIIALVLAAAGLYASDMVKAQSTATQVSCAGGGEGAGCGGGCAVTPKPEGVKAGSCGMHKQAEGKSSTCAKIAAMAGNMKPTDAKPATTAKAHTECNGDCGTCKSDCPKAGVKAAACPGGCELKKDCAVTKPGDKACPQMSAGAKQCDTTKCTCGATCPNKKAAACAETVKPAPKPAK